MSLLSQIEACLKLTRLPPSRFGRDAVSDPRIVHDLRRGRQPGERMQHRLRAHMARVLAVHHGRGAEEAAPPPRRGRPPAARPEAEVRP